MLSRTKFPKLTKAVFLAQISSLKGSHLLLNIVPTKYAFFTIPLSSERAILCESWEIAVKISGRKKAKVFISYLVHIQSKAILEQPNQEGTEKKASSKRKEGKHRVMFKSKNHSNVCLTCGFF